MPKADRTIDQVGTWVAEPGGAAPTSETLLVDVDGFEGPLDLLLELARRQKVDLSRISVLGLASQYLDFIASARNLRVEIVGDYLVMAAWLAYLKSKLLLPERPASADDETGAELAAALQLRLRRLEAMREAGARLMERSRLGRDVFARGMPQAVTTAKRPVYKASLPDLLMAYPHRRQPRTAATMRIATRPVLSLKDARATLTRMLGRAGQWAALDGFLLVYGVAGNRKSALASSFAASLEMVREGALEMRQESPFAPLQLRPSARLKPVAAP